MATLTVNGLEYIKKEIAYTEFTMKMVDLYGEDIIREHLVVEDGEYFVNDSVYEPLWDMVGEKMDRRGMYLCDYYGEMNIYVEYDEVVIEIGTRDLDWSEMRFEI